MGFQFSFFLWSESFARMRGFQIWPQNLNLENIWPLLATKWSKSGKVGYFACYWTFSSVFWPKGGQLLSDFNIGTRFGILSSRRNLLTTKWKKNENFTFEEHHRFLRHRLGFLHRFIWNQKASENTMGTRIWQLLVFFRTRLLSNDSSLPNLTDVDEGT